jgi:phage protein D
VSGSPSSPIPIPQFQVVFNGNDISAAFNDFISTATFESAIDSSSPDIQFDLTDNNQAMQNNLIPLGSELQCSIGYQAAPLFPIGTFFVDEIELNTDDRGDLFTIKACSLDPALPLQTANSRGYENVTLSQIAQQIAQKYGFTVVNAPVQPDVVFARRTQKVEPDLAFLARVSAEAGYTFSVRSKQLVFFSRQMLMLQPASATITRQMVNTAKFDNVSYSRKTYAAGQHAYLNPVTKALVQSQATDSTITSQSTINTIFRAENDQQAALFAQQSLVLANSQKIAPVLTMPGTMAYPAGTVINVQGWGAFDAVSYLIQKTRHSIDTRSGWTTELSLVACAQVSGTNNAAGTVNSSVFAPTPNLGSNTVGANQ